MRGWIRFPGRTDFKGAYNKAKNLALGNSNDKEAKDQQASIAKISQESKNLIKDPDNSNDFLSEKKVNPSEGKAEEKEKNPATSSSPSPQSSRWDILSVKGVKNMLGITSTPTENESKDHQTISNETTTLSSEIGKDANLSNENDLGSSLDDTKFDGSEEEENEEKFSTPNPSPPTTPKADRKNLSLNSESLKIIFSDDDTDLDSDGNSSSISIDDLPELPILEDDKPFCFDLSMDENSMYSGVLSHGKPENFGMLENPEAIYVGQFKENKKSGYGCMQQKMDQKKVQPPTVVVSNSIPKKEKVEKNTIYLVSKYYKDGFYYCFKNKSGEMIEGKIKQAELNNIAPGELEVKGSGSSFLKEKVIISQIETVTSYQQLRNTSEHHYGLWQEGELISGYTRRTVEVSTDERTQIKKIYYQGKVTNGKRQSLGELIISTHRKQSYRITASWQNDKIVQEKENAITQAEEQWKNSLFSFLTKDSNVQNRLEFNVIHRLAQILESHPEINNLEALNKLLKSTENSSFFSEFNDNVNEIYEIQLLDQYIRQRYFQNPVKFKKNIIEEMREKLVLYKKLYRNKLIQQAYNSSYNFDNCEESVKTFINGIRERITSNPSQLLLMDCRYIRFFIILADILQEKVVLLDRASHGEFSRRNVLFLSSLWSSYLESLDENYLYFSAHEVFIDSMTSFYQQLLDQLKILDALVNTSRKKFLFKVLEFIDQEPRSSEHAELFSSHSESIVLSDYVLNQNELEWKLNINIYYKIVNCLTRFKVIDLNDEADRSVLFARVAKILDVKEHELDKECYSNKLDKQIWIQLLFVVKHGSFSSIDQKKQGYIDSSYECYRRMIGQSQENEYGTWLMLIRSIKEFWVFISKSVENIELFGDQIEYLSKKGNDIYLFSDLLNNYIIYHKSHQNLFENLDRKLPSCFKDQYPLPLRKSLALLVESFITIQMPAEHLKALLAINNFLVQLNGLDLRWLIDETTLNETKISSTSSITCINDEKRLYCVTNSERFITRAKNKGFENFKHYSLLSILEILEKIQTISTDYDIEDRWKIQRILLETLTQSLVFLTDQEKSRSLEQFHSGFCKAFDYIIVGDSLKTIEQRAKLIERYLTFELRLNQISVDEALNMFRCKKTLITTEQNNLLKFLFETYEQEYRNYLNGFLENKIKLSEVIAQTLNESKKIAKPLYQWSGRERIKHVPKILAGIAFILSLHESGIIGVKSKSQSNETFILRPHCIQILGIFFLLNMHEWGAIPNNLAQILTGQGKSWALALLGSLFALTGHHVTIVCYNENLTQRDREAMTNFFHYLTVSNIKYATFEEMCWDKLYVKSQSYSFYIGDLVKRIINKTTARLEFSIAAENHNQEVLLIDEVDVLFTDLYGDSLYTCVVPVEKVYADLQKNIWNAIKNTDENNAKRQILNNFEMQFRAADPPFQDIELFLSVFMQSHVMSMIDSAMIVKSGKKDTDFRVNPTTFDIERRKGNSDVFSSSSYQQYQNAFQYLKRCDSAHRDYSSENKHKFGYLQVRVGAISYAEIPKQFPLILGVSGSLDCLSEMEEAALESYGINNCSYFPSFWGTSRLKFNSKEAKNYAISIDENAWHDLIVKRALEMATVENRGVLIFFETIERLEAFNIQCGRSRLPNAKVVTQNTPVEERKNIIESLSGQPNAVTLLTRAFGRGEDFKSSVAVNDRGGMHAIQTFLSIDLKEEIQIKGRVARKTDPGSFSLFLCLPHINETLGETINQTINYQELNELRIKKFNQNYSKKKEAVEAAHKKHEQTMRFMDSVINFFSTRSDGRDPPTRKELLQNLCEL